MALRQTSRSFALGGRGASVSIGLFFERQARLLFLTNLLFHNDDLTRVRLGFRACPSPEIAMGESQALVEPGDDEPWSFLGPAIGTVFLYGMNF
jgi:hypothetical protein